MLKKYLQQIKDGKTVHYSKMLQLLPPGFYQRRAELFKVKVTGAGKWQVSIVDAALFEQLWQSALEPANRQIASLQGDSHRANTSHSYILVYHQVLKDARPEVVLAQSQPDGNVVLLQNYLPKPMLLLIENEENFFRYSEVAAVSQQMLVEDFSLAHCDIALAAGSRIGSALLQPFLAQYPQIYCAFDYDAAGLETYDLLEKRWGDKVRLVVAPDLTPWLGGFVHPPKHSQQLTKALQLAEKHQLFGLVDAFSKSKNFLEQEVLLDRVDKRS
jgi:hypothetical protein